MSSTLQYRVARNHEEYLAITKETVTKNVKSIPFSLKQEPPFEDIQEWFDFFGASEKSLDEVDGEEWERMFRSYQGNLRVQPDEEEYPVLVVYYFEETFDRLGHTGLRLWDWVSLLELPLTLTD